VRVSALFVYEICVIGDTADHEVGNTTASVVEQGPVSASPLTTRLIPYIIAVKKN